MKVEQLDLGYHGYRLSVDGRDQGIIFGSEDGAKNEANRYPDKKCEITHHDTRPTIDRVRDIIRAAESHVWDEYMITDLSKRGEAKWPDDGRTCVYVVTGGSEGLYLHIEIGNECIILGKTLSVGHDAWTACYESAGRIAWMLGA